MINYYLLWATGEDQPGIVAALTQKLFSLHCNLEDSSMMKLGSEFAIFLIFTSSKPLSPATHNDMFSSLLKKYGLNVGFKKISKKLSYFKTAPKNLFMVSVHGHDKSGIVYGITRCLSRSKFNITDLSTHRTEGGKKPGYILFIEGELPKKSALSVLKDDLRKLQSKLGTRISIQPLNHDTF